MESMEGEKLGLLGDLVVARVRRVNQAIKMAEMFLK